MPTEQDLMQTLNQAIYDGDIRGARRAIAAGANVNGRPNDNLTFLQGAIDAGASLPMIRFLLNAGANMETKDFGHGDGREGTAIINAVASNRVDVVNELLSRGAQLNTTDAVGQGPLFYARSAEMVEVLVHNGANPNARANNGDTPLFNAAPYPEVVRALIRGGADVNEGNSLLTHYSIHPDSVRAYIAADGDINKTNDSGRTLLHETTNPEIARILIAADANKNARDDNGDTPLHRAAIEGKVEIATILLAAEADTTALNSSARTPFEEAMGEGNPNHGVLNDLFGSSVHPESQAVVDLLQAHADLQPDFFERAFGSNESDDPQIQHLVQQFQAYGIMPQVQQYNGNNPDTRVADFDKHDDDLVTPQELARVLIARDIFDLQDVGGVLNEAGVEIPDGKIDVQDLRKLFNAKNEEQTTGRDSTGRS